MPKISIIVPVYKVEKYLKECVDSIINQTYKDLEIILIDDGSPDSCGQIIDDYAANDSRIVPVHKENGGYASAINTGFERASGDFIGIVESDDYCALTMYEDLYNCIKNSDADFVSANCYNLLNSATKEVKERNLSKYVKPENGEEYYNLKTTPSSLGGPSGPWRNLYRKSFIDKYNLRMIDDDNGSYQDVPWKVLILTKAQKAVHLNKPVYYYRKDADGSSNNIGSRKILNYLIRRVQAKNILIENNLYNGDIKEYYDYTAYQGCLMFLEKIDRPYKKEYYDKMREIFKNMYSEGLIFKYFTQAKKEQFLAIIKNDYAKYKIWLAAKKIRDFIFCIKNGTNRKIICVLGIKISYKKK